MDYLDLTCKDSNLSDLDQMLSLEQRFFLSDHNLHYTDKMSMAAGIEVRVPFLGEEITKLASKIDEKLLITLFSSKRILKDSMIDCLPREIIHRPKTGFGAPIRKWVKSDLKAYIKDKITIENIKKTDILDYRGVMKLIKLNQDGKVDASYTIMQILSLIIWNDIRDNNLWSYFSKPKNGQLYLEDIQIENQTAIYLHQNNISLLSPGTEKMLLDFGKSGS